jgi:uncharacterized protein
MNFENVFTVQAPIDEVFATLMDVERVAPCMPGAEVLERVGDDAYKVGVKVKVGPISMLYRGQVEIVERDPVSHQATMQVKAREARGQGTADARVHMDLASQDGATRATLVTELQLSGRAASMGRGVIGDISGKLIEEFAANLAQMLGAGTEAPSGVAAPVEAATAGPEQLGGSGPPGGSTGAPAGASVSVTAPAASKTPPAATPAAAQSQAPAASPPAARSLPVAKIAASVIAGRLSNPRTLLVTTIVFAVIFLAIGFAIGRAA